MRKSTTQLDRRNRRQNLRVRGVPLSSHEALFVKVNEAADKLVVPVLANNDVIVAQTLPTGPDNVSGKILCFEKQSLRYNLFQRVQHFTRYKSDNSDSQNDVLVLKNQRS